MYLLLYHVYNDFLCRKWHWYSFIEQSCRGKTVFVVVWKTDFFFKFDLLHLDAFDFFLLFWLISAVLCYSEVIVHD